MYTEELVLLLSLSGVSKESSTMSTPPPFGLPMAHPPWMGANAYQQLHWCNVGAVGRTFHCRRCRQHHHHGAAPPKTTFLHLPSTWSVSPLTTKHQNPSPPPPSISSDIRNITKNIIFQTYIPPWLPPSPWPPPQPHLFLPTHTH